MEKGERQRCFSKYIQVQAVTSETISFFYVMHAHERNGQSYILTETKNFLTHIDQQIAVAAYKEAMIFWLMVT